MIDGLKRALEIVTNHEVPGPDTAPRELFTPEQAKQAWAGGLVTKAALIALIRAEILKLEKGTKTCH